MQENGEKIGYGCSIALTIIYALQFWATYKVIVRVDQKAKLFDKGNQQNTKASAEVQIVLNK